MQIARPWLRENIPWIRAILFCVLVSPHIPSLSAQQKDLLMDKRAAIENAVASFMSANGIPGLSAAVVLEGEPRWSQFWHGRSGRFFAGDLFDALSLGIHFQTHFRHGDSATLGARQAGPGCPGAKILSGVSAKRVAHYHAGTARTPKRHPPLQSRRKSRRPATQRAALRQHAGVASTLC